MGLMSNLSQFIGGAAEAGGDILQRDRESAVRQNEYQNNAQFTADLQVKRDEAIRLAREAMDIRTEGRAHTAKLDEETRVNSPEYLERSRTTDLAKRRGIMSNELELAPDAGRVDAAKFAAGAPTRKAKNDEDLQTWKDQFSAKSATELEADIKRMNDPKYLQGKAKEAAAGRDPNSASLHKVQLEAAKLALDEKKAEIKMPPAVKAQAEAYREQLKGKTAIIDKAMVEGTATPEGLKALEAQRDALNKKVEEIYRPYLGDKAPAEQAPPKQAPPPDGTRGKIDGVMGTVINGQFVPDKPKPAAKQDKRVSKALPRSFDEIPGVEDTSTKVGSGLELMLDDRARKFAANR